MIEEKSCGAVIFIHKDGKLLFLVEKMVKGHTSLCKGHVENGENEHETATREIKEETGLTVKFADGFRESIEYSPYSGCRKKVVFFLAEAESDKTTAQPEEVREIFWAEYKEAYESLTHESDRGILKKAYCVLMGK